MVVFTLPTKATATLPALPTPAIHSLKALTATSLPIMIIAINALIRLSSTNKNISAVQR